MKTKKLLTQCSILSMLAFCAAPPAMAMLDDASLEGNHRAGPPHTSAVFNCQEEEVTLRSPLDSQTLEQALKTSHTKKLTIWFDNPITDAEAQIIGTALSTNQTPKTLELNSHELSLIRSGTDHIAAALKKNTTLEELGLSNCARSQGLHDKGTVLIAGALEANPNTALKRLDLYNNNIGQEGASALGNLFASNTSLQTVKLGYNQFKDEGACAIGRGLKQNNSIQDLDFHQNNIGSDGIRSIMTALAQNPNIPLRTLNISHNPFEDGGACAVSRFLAITTTLQVLDIRDTHMTDEGVQSIIKALITNPYRSFHTLNLGSTSIELEGARSIARLLADSDTLQEFSFNCPTITGEMITIIREGLALNRSLRHFKLSNIGYPDSIIHRFDLETDVHLFLSVLEKNTALEITLDFLGLFRKRHFLEHNCAPQWLTENPHASRLTF